MKNFTFKKLSKEDIPLVHAWLKKPHLKEFLNENSAGDLEAFRKKFEGVVEAENLDPYIVYLQGKPIGYIQAYHIDDKTYGIDQFIGVPEFVNKGLGSMFVKEFTDELLMSGNVTRIITDPKAGNLRAQKAYEKAGFKKKHELPGDDGNIVVMEKKIKSKIKKAS